MGRLAAAPSLSYELDGEVQCSTARIGRCSSLPATGDAPGGTRRTTLPYPPRPAGQRRRGAAERSRGLHELRPARGLGSFLGRARTRLSGVRAGPLERLAGVRTPGGFAAERLL